MRQSLIYLPKSDRSACSGNKWNYLISPKTFHSTVFSAARFFQLACDVFRFIHVRVYIRTCSFIFSSNIPLYGYITFLFMNSSVDNDLFPLGSIINNAAVNILAAFYTRVFSQHCIAMPYSAVALTVQPLFIHWAHALLSTPSPAPLPSTLQVPPHLSCCTTQKLSHHPVCSSQLFHLLPIAAHIQPSCNSNRKHGPKECFANGLESIRPLILYTHSPQFIFVSYWINVYLLTILS